MQDNRFARMTGTGLFRLVGAGVLVLTTLAVSAGAATAAGSCHIATLPVPPGTSRSDVTAGDPTGRYLIGTALFPVDGEMIQESMLWVNGRLTDVPTSHPQAVLVDVNATGTVVGHSVTDGRASAFRYQRGHFTALPGLHAADGSYAVAVNGRGDVLGYSVEPDLNQHIVVWPARRPSIPRELVAPVGLNAIDIDDDGTALGSAFTGQANTYLWRPDGTAQQVRGPSGGTDVLALAIRRGWIGGFDNYTSNGVVAAWRTRGGPTNLVPNWQSFVYTVNGHGDLGLQGAIDRRRGGLVTVPDLGGPSGVQVLSDRGIAAGFASDGFQVHAVIWRGC
jgi:hypothetical protein